MPVTARRAALAVFLIVLLGFFVYSFRRGSNQVSPEELAARVAESRPEWANYQEDLKAQVGVTPLAEWEGKPLSARHEGRDLHITFQVDGPWSERDVALPILLRDPFGNARRNLSAECQGRSVVYRFYFPDIARDAPLPWVEIQYPGRERRLVFSEQGEWPADTEDSR